jgi:hypothetical protein
MTAWIDGAGGGLVRTRALLRSRALLVSGQAPVQWSRPVGRTVTSTWRNIVDGVTA